MNRRKLVKQLLALGAIFFEEGAKHTIYRNPRTGQNLSVPRHTTVMIFIAKDLIRDASK